MCIILFLLSLACGSFGSIFLQQVTEPVIHGEGPHWDSERQFLYFVDIENHTINKYDPRTQYLTQAYIDGGPPTIIISDKFDEKQFVISRGLDIVTITWDGLSPKPSELKVLASVEADKPENRFNDGKVDASGRLWAGTMGPEKEEVKPLQGSLYSFDWSEEFRPVNHLSPVSISNGIAWNQNDTLMYYIDTSTNAISVFDFDIVNGAISNRRELFNLEKYNIDGKPDGMAIDGNDNLWVAVFKGGCVLHIDTREGKLLNKINFPVKKVTSCAFGGPYLEDLYVTTSRKDLSEKELKEQPLAGALFKVSGAEIRGQFKANAIRIPSIRSETPMFNVN